MANLVIISGSSASGKSTLADRLSKDLHLPVLHRDRIKEALFDTLGYSDRERSKELGIATALVLARQVEDILNKDVSCIIEAKFNPKFSESEILHILHTTGAKAVQIQCNADGETLYVRFKERALSLDRHPGHDEANNLDDFKDELLTGRLDSLQLGDDVLEYNTTEHDESLYKKLLEQVRNKLGKPAQDRT